MKLIFVALFLATALLAYGQSISDRLPNDFGDGLALVPNDIESFAAISRPFEMPRWIGKNDSFFISPLKPSSTPLHVFAQSMISFALTSDLDSEVFDEVTGAPIKWAMFAKRKQDKPVAVGLGATGGVPLGLHPFEAVSIVRFQTAVPQKLVNTVRNSWTLAGESNCSFWKSPHGTRFLMMSDQTLISVKVLRADSKMLHDVCNLAMHQKSSFALDSVESKGNTLDFSADIWSAKKDRSPNLVNASAVWILSSYRASTETMVYRQFLAHVKGYAELRLRFQKPAEMDVAEFQYRSVIQIVDNYLQNTVKPLNLGDFAGLNVMFILQMMGIPILL